MGNSLWSSNGRPVGSAAYRRFAVFPGRSMVWGLGFGIPLIGIALAVIMNNANSSSGPSVKSASVQTSPPHPSDTSEQAARDIGAPHGADEQTTQSVSETTLSVNDESVPIPENGSVHKVIDDGTSTTTVDVVSESQSNGTGENSTSLQLKVNSVSKAEVSSGEGP